MKTANTNSILRRLTALLLTLVMVVGALPTRARAADSKLPDWYFLVVIFKEVDAPYKEDGVTKREKNTLTQEEIDLMRLRAKQFDEYMNSLGVMNAHVDVIEISTPVTSLTPSDSGLWISKDDAFPILEKANVDLTKYDHVTGMAKFDTFTTEYVGLTDGNTGIGTGYSFHNVTYYNIHTATEDWETVGLFVHEFLHSMENLSRAWGITFDEHTIQKSYEPNTDNWKTCYTDILLNRAKGDGGTGVPRFVWEYTPIVLRTTRLLNVPEGALAIGDFAFQDMENLIYVTIPDGVQTIGDVAFTGCSNLATVTLPDGLVSIGEFAFRDCSKLVKVSLPASVSSIGYAAFYDSSVQGVYYGGTEAQWNTIQMDEFNEPLKNAAIHFQSDLSVITGFQDVAADAYYAAPVKWAVQKGVTGGTSATEFSPDDACTQAQIITFLWRTAGSPRPSGNAISGSVTPDRYYYDAVEWASGEGIILSGNDEFHAGEDCTRAMAVNYIWRYAGKPSSDTVPPFTDLNENDAPAVAWALDNNVTNGTSATEFSPDTPCTRSQIVTFLYKAFG